MDDTTDRIAESEALERVLALYRSRPQAYRIKVELDIPEWLKDKAVKYGKCEKGLSRTFCVPNMMTLHSLHYMIQKAFGLKNIHPRSFRLDHEDFREFTGDSLGKWLDYVGTYFRFPYTEEEGADWYWAEKKAGTPETAHEYNVFLRERYNGPYVYEGFSEQYIPARLDVLHWKDEHGDLDLNESGIIMGLGTLYGDDWDPGELSEMLRIDEVLMPVYETPELEEFRVEFEREQKESDGSFDMILENIDEARDAYDKACRALDDTEGAGVGYSNAYNEMALRAMEYYSTCHDYRPHLEPVANRLRYSYGEPRSEWRFTVTMLDEYWDESEYDTSSSDTFFDDESSMLTDELVIEDHAHEILDDETAHAVMDAADSECPVCIEADGYDIVENIGGPEELFGFFEDIGTLPREERDRLTEKAVNDGWCSVPRKPNRML